MKGFIKILEAIISSVIILTSLTFFFNTQIEETQWGDALLKVRADDVAYALVESGELQAAVDSNNVAVLNALLLDPDLAMMPITLDYSVEIRGIPNPVIYVGCANCTPGDKAFLDSLLEPMNFLYKDRQISIRSEFDDIEKIRNETNALVMFGYQNLNPHKQYLTRFLERGGTIVLIDSTLSQPEVEDFYLNETFGLKWSVAGSTNPSGSILQQNNETRASFRINKYYSNLTGSAGSFAFVGPVTARIQSDHKTVVHDGSLSLAKVNYEIEKTRGRTVWMAEPLNQPETANLTKAIIMWASGESFRMDSVPKNPAPKNFKSSVFVYDKDPYELVLTVWKIFQ